MGRTSLGQCLGPCWGIIAVKLPFWSLVALVSITAPAGAVAPDQGTAGGNHYMFSCNEGIVLDVMVSADFSTAQAMFDGASSGVLTRSVSANGMRYLGNGIEVFMDGQAKLASLTWDGYVDQCTRIESPATGPVTGPTPPIAPGGGFNVSGTCAGQVQGRVAWDYSGSTTWDPANVQRLCRGAENSIQPAECFNRVMHGGVNYGGGTQWVWTNAIDLCEGSLNANATIGCFTGMVGNGVGWAQAIATCGN